MHVHVGWPGLCVSSLVHDPYHDNHTNRPDIDGNRNQ